MKTSLAGTSEYNMFEWELAEEEKNIKISKNVLYTGSFTRTALFNMLITPFKMSMYKVKLDAKFH